MEILTLRQDMPTLIKYYIKLGGFLIEIETKLACLFHICNKLANLGFYFDRKSTYCSTFCRTSENQGGRGFDKR